MGHKSSKPHPQPATPQEIHQTLAANHGHNVSLFSEFANGHVHADHNEHIDAKGKADSESHWKLHHVKDNVIQLERAGHAGKFLKIDHHSATANGGSGDADTHLKVSHDHHTGAVSLVNHQGHGLGFEKNGSVKTPESCGSGPHTHLKFEFH